MSHPSHAAHRAFGALLAGVMFVAGSHAALAAGDAAKGQQVFQGQCAACHSVTPGTNLFGPSLATIYASKAASVANYSYSPALTNANITWTDAALDKFLTAPQTDVPGTKMPFAGIADAQQRQDVIAYLAQLKTTNAAK